VKSDGFRELSYDVLRWFTAELLLFSILDVGFGKIAENGKLALK